MFRVPQIAGAQVAAPEGVRRHPAAPAFSGLEAAKRAAHFRRGVYLPPVIPRAGEAEAVAKAPRMLEA